MELEMATNERSGALLKIGELAGRLGLNVRTLRYYEARGLLKPSARSASGYRLYSAADEQLLRFVLQAKHIGFSLEEIEEMVRRSRRGSPCDYVRNTLQEHLDVLDKKIAELQALRAELRAAQAAWQEPEACASGTICGLIEGWPAASITQTREVGMANKRQVEVFTAGCPLCDETVQLVNSLACPNCEVTVYDLREGCATNECREKAKAYGVHRVPAVVIDGKLADCCSVGPVSADALRAAGLGAG